MGGVAIAWKKGIDIHKLPKEGNERIITVLIPTSKPCLVVNVYMPSQGKESSNYEYQRHTDILRDICKRYRHDHNIIIAGDWNASLQRTRPNKADQMMRDFLIQLDLSNDTISTPTFYHHSGTACSKIDYFVYNNEAPIGKFENLGDHHLNSSSHRCITAEMSIQTNKAETKKTKSQRVSKRDWKQVNLEQFQAKVEDCFRLDNNAVNTERPTMWDIEMKLATITHAIHEAVSTSIPMKTVTLKGPKQKLPAWVIQRSREAKVAYISWAKAGKPKDGDLFQNMRLTQRSTRSGIRYINAMKKRKLYADIRNGPSDKHFFQLINQQLTGSKEQLPDVIRSLGTRIEDPAKQCDLLAAHYQSLATPAEDPLFDNQYLTDVKNLNMVAEICSTKTYGPEFSEEEIFNAVLALNKKKAADKEEIRAEHLFMCTDTLTVQLQSLFNMTKAADHIPLNLKEGVITSLPKKGKDPEIPQHHRGITITATIGKVLEHTHRNRENTQLRSTQSNLQFGFTEDMAPLVAAIVVTEAMVTAKHNKQDLFIATLDAQKAFDVVCHDILFNTMRDTTSDDFTLFLNRAYEGLESQVKWQGHCSQPFKVKQGVRQGGVISTNLYKSYIDPLLHSLETDRLGCCIGSTYIGIPTVADDTLLLANSPEEMQNMLDRVADFANQRRYTIHPEKSQILSFTTAVTEGPEQEWTLNGKTVSVAKTVTHLGTTRSTSDIPDSNVQDRVSSARRTAYALLGAGMHGRNGVGTQHATHIYKCYVIPRLLYGLETLGTKTLKIKDIERFHLQTLKDIQGLPSRTATSAVYLLTGILPIQAIIDLKRLSLIGTIARSHNDTLHTLALHQVATLKPNSGSWFVTIAETLQKYDLPSLTDLLNNPIHKVLWKTTCKRSVCEWWSQLLRQEASQMSTLVNLNPPPAGKLHLVWAAPTNSDKDVLRSQVKARILTGTFMLQTTKARFNQFTVNANCPLCKSADETLSHFLIHCTALETSRSSQMSALLDAVYRHAVPQLTLPIDPVTLIKLIVDCSSFKLHTETEIDIEICSRALCFNLHSRREYLLQPKET